jgi:hypothetical protein
MGLKRKLNAAVKPVENLPEDLQRDANHPLRKKEPAHHTKVLEVREEEPPNTENGDYISLEVRGTGNKVYKVVIPRSYAKSIPKNWSWDAKRYKAAELIAAGYPMTEVAKIIERDRSVIYGWLQHPEFKEHVDGLTLETGWANQRERIAGLNRVTRLLFDKVVNELGHVKLTDKSIGAVLSSLQMIAKQIGQEKGEFVEQSKVENNTTLSGAIGIAEMPVDAVLNEKTVEERRALEDEFNKLGDDIIRNITGEK